MHLLRTNPCMLITITLALFFKEPLVLTAKTSTSTVVLAKGNGLAILNLTSPTITDLQSDNSKPYRVDSLQRTDGNLQLFWSDTNHHNIRSGILANDSLLNSSDLVGSKETGNVEALAVDWVGGNVYFVVIPFGRIDVVRIDGKFHSNVVLDLVHPKALAVDSLSGLMFWSDENSIIERSSLAGGDRVTIVEVGDILKKVWVNAITLDHRTKQIYWVDASSNSIFTASYDGLNVRRLVEDKHFLKLPYSLSFISGDLLWSDGSLKSIVQMNVKNVSSMAIAYEMTQPILDVKVLNVDRGSLEISSHVCLKRNGGCSHLCLRDGYVKFKCVCPFGLELSEDQRTCKVPSGVLIIVGNVYQRKESNEIPVIFRQNALNPSKLIFPPIKLNKNSEVKALAYDDSIDLLVWLDSSESKLNYQSRNRKGSFVVSLESTSIAIERMIEGQVYVSRSGQSPCISVCDLSTHACVPLLIDRIWSPRSLFVVKSNLVWLDNDGSRILVQMYSTRNGERRILESGKDICCLTVDPVSEEVFWMNKGKIQKYSFESEFAVALDLSLPDKDFELLAVFDGIIYANNTQRKSDLKMSSWQNKRWNSLVLPPQIRSESAVFTAALTPKASPPTSRPTWSNDRKRISLQLKKIEFELTTLKSADGACKCLNGVCESNCTCIHGFNGCDLEKFERVCRGYCSRGQCSVDYFGGPTCECDEGWGGRQCDNNLSLRDLYRVADESLLRKLRLKYHISMGVILSLSAVILVLLTLLMRKKRDLATTSETSSSRQSDTELNGQKKQLRWPTFFTPHLNQLKGNTDQCCLLDHQKDPALSNTHV